MSACKCTRNMVCGNGKGTGAVRFCSTWRAADRASGLVVCTKCEARWKSKAAYVGKLPGAKEPQS